MADLEQLPEFAEVLKDWRLRVAMKKGKRTRSQRLDGNDDSEEGEDKRPSKSRRLGPGPEEPAAVSSRTRA